MCLVWVKAKVYSDGTNHMLGFFPSAIKKEHKPYDGGNDLDTNETTEVLDEFIITSADLLLYI